MTKDEILKIIEEKNINFFRIQFCDINGMTKNVAIPRSQIEKALDGKIMFDGSSVEGFARIEESDMLLKPDLDTYVLYPFQEQAGKDIFSWDIQRVAFMSRSLTNVRERVTRKAFGLHLR